jgi:hypothetical protein
MGIFIQKILDTNNILGKHRLAMAEPLLATLWYIIFKHILYWLHVSQPICTPLLVPTGALLNFFKIKIDKPWVQYASSEIIQYKQSSLIIQVLQQWKEIHSEHWSELHSLRGLHCHVVFNQLSCTCTPASRYLACLAWTYRMITVQS